MTPGTKKMFNDAAFAKMKKVRAAVYCDQQRLALLHGTARRNKQHTAAGEQPRARLWSWFTPSSKIDRSRPHPNPAPQPLTPTRTPTPNPRAPAS